MVEPQSSKLATRVRFSSPAPPPSAARRLTSSAAGRSGREFRCSRRRSCGSRCRDGPAPCRQHACDMRRRCHQAPIPSCGGAPDRRSRRRSTTVRPAVDALRSNPSPCRHVGRGDSWTVNRRAPAPRRGRGRRTPAGRWRGARDRRGRAVRPGGRECPADETSLHVPALGPRVGEEEVGRAERRRRDPLGQRVTASPIWTRRFGTPAVSAAASMRAMPGT